MELLEPLSFRNPVTLTPKLCSGLSGIGGLVREEVRLGCQNDGPSVVTWIVRLGDISQARTRTIPGQRPAKSKTPVQGIGSSLDEEEAIHRAYGEAWERYCSYTYNDDQFICATAQELGADGLDLDTIPRCSAAELSGPRCPLVFPDKNVPMRWVRGLSLLTGRPLYLPAVMVYLRTGYISREERICLPITTGCAAHTSLERALLSSVLEVVERDAISITWLQRLSLPRIEVDHVGPVLAPYWDSYNRASKELEYLFFDATTDLGIPIVYGLQLSRASKHAATLVSCSASLDPIKAITKVMSDMAAFRRGFRTPRQVPEKWEDFTEILHGAIYMARAERTSAFDFLVKSDRRHLLSKLAKSHKNKDDDQADLMQVLNILRSKNLEAYAVELSTDEALRFGVRVVRVIIPGLQPLSLNYRARYLGHPRLYEAPKHMGYEAHDEDQLNHWPQPFA
jgi:ribosomal protein S12 methylthiotransferase accessory factor